MNFKINAEPRNSVKKSDRKNLRKTGFIPAVIYGHGEKVVSISINRQDFMRSYRKSIGEFAFFDIVLDNHERRTIIREKQIHPVSRDIIHIDFLELSNDKEVNIDIPLKFRGEAPGVKAGGSLEILLRKLELICLPGDIPEDIEIDLSVLKLGKSIHIGDLDVPNARFTSSPDQAVAIVHPPRGGKVDAEEEEEAAE